MPTLMKGILHEITAEIFRAVGAPDDLADQVADVLVDNHLAGHDSHGILRIPEYVRSVRAGEIIPTARPRVLEESATSALVSGNWAFGQVTGVFAADLAIEKAKRERVAVLSVVQAGHTGRLAAFTERAARQNVAMFMAIGTVGGSDDRALWRRGPGAGYKPSLLLDSQPRPALPSRSTIATSAIAAGKIKVAKAKHERLPPDAILDRHGRPSTDPQAFFDGGFLLPFGGHKGYALAVIAELLSGPLAGADAYPGRNPPQRDLHFRGGRGRLSAAGGVREGAEPKRSAGSRPCRRDRVLRKCCCRANLKPAPAPEGNAMAYRFRKRPGRQSSPWAPSWG